MAENHCAPQSLHGSTRGLINNAPQSGHSVWTWAHSAPVTHQMHSLLSPWDRSQSEGISHCQNNLSFSWPAPRLTAGKRTARSGPQTFPATCTKQSSKQVLVASMGQFKHTHKDGDAQLFQGHEPLLRSVMDTSHSYKPYHNCVCI